MSLFRKPLLIALSIIGPSLGSTHAQAPPRGPGGFPSLNAEERKILDQFDKDENGHLNQKERAAARVFLKENPGPKRGGPGRPKGRRGPQVNNTPATPGAKISPSDISPTLSGDLYATDTLRTLFLTFENEDWEAELEAFHGTDVEVPAKLMVDGKTYEDVGIRFRGKSSYHFVPAGRKRSFNVSIDAIHKKQRINEYKTLNLLNCNGDGSFLSGVLYSDIARQYIPAPKANHVRVVVNGENWGIYANQQQFNKDFIQENYRTAKGARWKVPGSPRGKGGLNYIGDKIKDYEERYEMKSGDDDDWKALIALCKTLTETPLEELEAALEPQLDIDGALWFIALDCALINSDGYWTRASDYSIYRGKDGRFRLIPHDMNEGFRAARLGRPPGRGGPPELGRPPGRGGPPELGRPPGRGGPPQQDGANAPNGLHLDPLIALDDPEKPLRSRLLSVPALRDRYLEKVRHIAQQDLDWTKLGPKVAAYRDLIGKEIAADTRKSSSTEAFEILTADSPAKATDEDPPNLGHGSVPLHEFAEQRRAFLLKPPAK